MKLPKKFSLFIFFSLFLATILSVISCRFDLLNAESEKELEEALSNEVHFYSCEEGGAAAPVVITKRFPIGIRHNSSDFLSGSELSRLSGGRVFLGYKFYRMTESGSTVRPSYVQVNSDEYITTSFVSVDEMDFVTDWGVNYTVRHFLQNTDGTTNPSTPYLSQTFTVHTGENSNATVLSGSDIAGFTYDASSSDSLVQPVAADGSTVINLYYTRNLIYLTINLNGGNIGGNYANATLSGRYGASTASEIEANIPTDPELTGKYFAGWEPPLPETFPAGDASFTAQWGDYPYTVKHLKQNVTGSGYTEDESERETLYGVGNTNATAKTFTGFTYDSANSDALVQAIAENGSTVINVRYARNTHSVIYAGGAAGVTNLPDTQTDIRYGATVNVNFTNQPERTGHTFTGWNDGTTTYTNVSDGVTSFDMPDSDVTLTAQWDTITYTLTFNLNGGNIGGDTSSQIRTGIYNSAVTLANPAKTGYVFAGWQYSDDDGATTQTAATAPTVMPAINRVYNATWDPATDTQYIVKHMQQNTTGSGYTEVTDDRQTLTGTTGESTEAVANTYTGFNTPTVTQETIAPDGLTVVVINYTRKTYSVTYDDGLEDVTISVPSGINFRYGANVNVNFTSIGTRTGYTLAGWNTSDTSADGTVASYTSGGTTGFTMPDHAVTLTAQWSPVEYTITYNLDGGTNNPSNPATYTIVSGVALADPTKTNYQFDGWYLNSSFTSTSLVTAIDPGTTGSKTLYAKWLPRYAEIKVSGATSGTMYYSKADAVTAIIAATGNIDIVLYSGAQLTPSTEEGSLTNAIRNSSANSINLSIASGETVPISLSSYCIFLNCTKLVSVDLTGVSLSTSSNDMTQFFSGCNHLTSVNLGTLDTSKITRMSQMFKDCAALTTLDLSSLNTSSVTGTYNANGTADNGLELMFGGCSSLTSINLTGWDTSKVVNMREMFRSCSALTTLDLSNLNTSSVQNMQGMFFDCTSLTTVNLSGLDTSKVKNMMSMFNHCIALSSIDLSSFNTEALINMASMFYQCSELRTLDLRSFNTANVSNMGYLFASCSKLIAIAVSDNFVTTGFTSSTPQANGLGLFTGCTSLVGGAGFTYDASKTDRYSARIDGEPTSSVHGYFRRNLPIGTKIKPDAVGDIVFNDGSAMAYEDLAALDNEALNEKKPYAIAYIFYTGAGLNNDGDDSTRILGMGLKLDTSSAAWTTMGAAQSTQISSTYCTLASSGTGINKAINATGVKNGKDNLSLICDQVSGAADVVNDPDTFATSFPPFYFAKNYKLQLTNVERTAFEDGWYLPSVAELYAVYCKKSDIRTALSKLGFSAFQTGTSDRYRSSTQSSSSASQVLSIKWMDGESLSVNKNGTGYDYVLVIREFN